MLSRNYVKNKMRAAAARRQGSDIQPLINKRDQSNLAMALTNDRDLAHKLFLQQLFNTNTYNKILQAINKIKGKYFAKLSDSLTLTNNPQSAGQALNHTNRGSSLPLQTSALSNTRHHLGNPLLRSGISQSIYNTIASSFGSTKSSIRSRPYFLSSNNDCDKATFHINLKKAD